MGKYSALLVGGTVLTELLLRLYEQSEGDSVRKRECFDALDELLASGASYEVLERLDA